MISVIIPLYNLEGLIIECLESVRAQDFDDFEVIIVNDGSTDTGGEKALSFIEQHGLDSFHLYTKQNGGISSARNFGLKQASGEWIFFLDGDDWIEPNCLSSLAEVLKRYPSDLVIGGCVAHDCVTGEVELWSNYEKEYAKMPEGLQTLDSFGFCWGRLFKKSIIDEHQVYFDERIKYTEDVAWLFDYVSVIGSYSCTNDTLYNYRFNRNGSLTGKLTTPQMKRNVWEHYCRFSESFDNDVLEKSIETNILLNRAVWGCLSTAIVNDILDKNYKEAKEKKDSDTAALILRTYKPRTKKDIIFIRLWKTSFLLLRWFVVVYYKNFPKIRRSKLLEKISKAL